MEDKKLNKNICSTSRKRRRLSETHETENDVPEKCKIVVERMPEPQRQEFYLFLLKCSNKNISRNHNCFHYFGDFWFYESMWQK